MPAITPRIYRPAKPVVGEKNFWIKIPEASTAEVWELIRKEIAAENTQAKREGHDEGGGEGTPSEATGMQSKKSKATENDIKKITVIRDGTATGKIVPSSVVAKVHVYGRTANNANTLLVKVKTNAEAAVTATFSGTAVAWLAPQTLALSEAQKKSLAENLEGATGELAGDMDIACETSNANQSKVFKIYIKVEAEEETNAALVMIV